MLPLLPSIPSAPYVLSPAQDPTAARDAEWILPSGNGSFAMGTAIAHNRRKYHALLVGAAKPPVGRLACWNTLAVACITEPGTAPIALDETDPVRFEKTPTSCMWIHRVGGVELSKELRMGWRDSSASLRVTITGLRPGAEIILSPGVTLRDFHEVLDEDAGDHEITIDRSTCRISRLGSTLSIRASIGEIVSVNRWVQAPEYDLESQRGYPAHESVPIPCEWRVPVSGSTIEITLAASLSEPDPDPAMFDDHSRDEHLAQIEQRAVRSNPAIEPALALVRAADDFLIEREVTGRRLASVLAGFPWFADWGRDTMIALPGLMLECGRYEDARDCLATFAQHTSRGMIPNRFDDDTNEPHFNTVDASLWFVHACREYLARSRDRETIDTVLLPACEQIIDGYTAGTRFGIRVDPEDGLVAAGDDTTQLTWMDAKRDGVVFTPRHGKAVEINALWHNALRCVAELQTDIPERARELRSRADRVSGSFVRAFCSTGNGGLIDCLRPTTGGSWEPVNERRPNQLFAVSLPFSPLPKAYWQGVVRACEPLVTPFGMRTLDPCDPKYRPRFDGTMMQRDAAYHNGTVWPWLIGPYCEAHLRAHEFSEASRAHCAAYITPLIDSLSTGCLGQIAEVYDASEPHTPQGCVAQAWSVAEVLRVAMLVTRTAQ
jgi:predicted glycogen debranching enzyme